MSAVMIGKGLFYNQEYLFADRIGDLVSSSHRRIGFKAGDRRIAIGIGVIHIKESVLLEVGMKRDSKQPLFTSLAAGAVANVQEWCLQELPTVEHSNQPFLFKDKHTP